MSVVAAALLSLLYVSSCSSTPQTTVSATGSVVDGAPTTAALEAGESFEEYLDDQVARRLPPAASLDAGKALVAFPLTPPASLGPPQEVFALGSPYGSALLLWRESPLGPAFVAINDQLATGDHPEVGNVELQRKNYTAYAEQSRKELGLHGSISAVELPTAGVPALLFQSEKSQALQFIVGKLLVTAETSRAVDSSVWQELADDYAVQLAQDG